MLDWTRNHEHVHVGQYMWWGPFFLPAYGLSSLICKWKGKNPYLENRFEKVAYGLYPCFGGPPAKPDAQGPSRLEPEVIAQSEAKTPAQPEAQAAAPPPQENKPA